MTPATDLWGESVEAPVVEQVVKPLPRAPRVFVLRTCSTAQTGGYWKVHALSFRTREEAKQHFLQLGPAYRRAIIYELRDPLQEGQADG